MGLFDILFKKQHSDQRECITNDNEKKYSDNIDADCFIEASEKYQRKIYKRFYSDYPEKPFISKNRELHTNWIERAENFPSHSIIPRSMMTRYHDGLLPGHIYMMYWINKYTNKKIPSYFEYEYGINFNKEKNFLIDSGYLKNNKPTEKGIHAINTHYSVIEERHPKPKKDGNISDGIVYFPDCGRVILSTIPNGKLYISESDKMLIATEIQMINKAVITAKKISGITADLTIEKNELCFFHDYTYYEFQKSTPNGRKTKYPLTLHYSCFSHKKNNPEKDYFGEISYDWNGRICKARLIYWRQHKGYMIHIGTIKNNVIIKKVEISDGTKWIVKYKTST